MRALTAAGAVAALRAQTPNKPNIIIILADDLGYGDLGCYGSSLPTPNLDQLAKDGVRLTRFYCASAVCSPSRAALLTGRYPVRSGIVNVLMPNSTNGLSTSERTLPKVLKEQNYRTGCYGKWHLGSKPEFMPNRHFDESYCIPYSNDMDPLPIVRNGQMMENGAPKDSLTRRFTEQAVEFINRNSETPFFLYLAYSAPHIPLAPGAAFRDKSGQGIYGDVVAEMDDGIGQVLAALKRNGIADNTLVIFTSDNGPWYQGSTGNLQGRKGSTYEGGVRTPFLARFPGRFPGGLVASGIASMMDLLPTLGRVAGSPVPEASVDGVDIWPMLTGDQPYITREPLLFFDCWELQCVRWGPWKLHLSRYNSVAWTQDPVGGRYNLPLPRPELYNVDEDPGESYDRAPERAELIADLKTQVERMLLAFPDDVRSAWRNTMSRLVQATPAGALPVREP
ncbi:MAG TPA: sulfatase [Bryobacteraceae bacterium]|nr:sulfatase [Bryobacteraceae bacterium]